MQLWVMVPAKPLTEGKSRLASVLSPEERTELSRRLLSHTLARLQEVDEITGMLVISRDRSVLEMAEAAGAVGIREQEPAEAKDGWPDDPLNRAVRQGQAAALDRAASHLLILPADLPMLTSDEVRRLVKLAQEPGILIVPSHDVGTNALLLSPPDALPPSFGPESFERHTTLARRSPFPLLIVHSAIIAFDLDLPVDLARLRQHEFGE